MIAVLLDGLRAILGSLLPVLREVHIAGLLASSLALHGVLLEALHAVLRVGLLAVDLLAFALAVLLAVRRDGLAVRLAGVLAGPRAALRVVLLAVRRDGLLVVLQRSLSRSFAYCSRSFSLSLSFSRFCRL